MTGMSSSVQLRATQKPQPAADLLLQQKGCSWAKHTEGVCPATVLPARRPCPGTSSRGNFLGWPTGGQLPCLPAGGPLTKAETGSAGNEPAKGRPWSQKGHLFLGRPGVLVESAGTQKYPDLPSLVSAWHLSLPCLPSLSVHSAAEVHSAPSRPVLLVASGVPAEPWEW